MKKITESEALERFDEFLNETSQPVKIGTLEYEPATVLKETDLVAYRCGFNDWLDWEGLNID